jgi:hypothetical protein
MKQRFFTWLATQLAPQIEAAARAEVARLEERAMGEITRQLAERQAPAQPQRRFIGQK